ncbi:hypothetical protein [Mesorhizobium sp. B2-6-4]|uniref:hypothetical protein n=1 Tax=Mesorhizobium sp. B2-6-4 TaxID=2589913 RepID=UPI001127E540|nr:hypothetical protein [Mesorhizobium sp. B2-6-4]TPJ52711.1 hypothetical protein FJ426_15775 [Mesorhizobium sp. B2-6-4]
MSLGLGLGLTRQFKASGGAPPAFDPTTLFANGETGAWYDPSDLSTLFQDSAMNTPVTANGDPVGAILDKSGNELHLLQATDTARPTYKTDGILHWLEFTGGSDLLRTGNILSVDNTTDDLYMGVASSASSTALVVHMTIGTSGEGILIYSSGSTYNVSATDNSGFNFEKSASIAVDTHYAVFFSPASATPDADEMAFRVDTTDGATTNNDTPFSPGLIFVNTHIALNTISTSPNSQNVIFYGGIVVLRTMSAQNKGDCTTFFGAKAGLTL